MGFQWFLAPEDWTSRGLPSSKSIGFSMVFSPGWKSLKTYRFLMFFSPREPKIMKTLRFSKVFSPGWKPLKNIWFLMIFSPLLFNPRRLKIIKNLRVFHDFLPCWKSLKTLGFSLIFGLRGLKTTKNLCSVSIFKPHGHTNKQKSQETIVLLQILENRLKDFLVSPPQGRSLSPGKKIVTTGWGCKGESNC